MQENESQDKWQKLKLYCKCGNPVKVGEPVNECWYCYTKRDYVFMTYFDDVIDERKEQ
jgi:hypothetical protein